MLHAFLNRTFSHIRSSRRLCTAVTQPPASVPQISTLPFPDFLSPTPAACPLEALDRRLASQGILLEDALLVHSLEELESLESFQDVYTKLYGDERENSLPILRPGLGEAAGAASATLRRQYIIERLSQRLGLEEFLQHRMTASKFSATPAPISVRRSGKTLLQGWIAGLGRVLPQTKTQGLTIKLEQLHPNAGLHGSLYMGIASITVRTTLGLLCAPRNLRSYNTPGLEDKQERESQK